MKKAELVTYIEENDLDIDTSAKRDDLIQVLEELNTDDVVEDLIEDTVE